MPSLSRIKKIVKGVIIRLLSICSSKLVGPGDSASDIKNELIFFNFTTNKRRHYEKVYVIRRY
jgi:hypothetical protein